MADPIISPAAVAATTMMASPVLVVFGVPLGLQAPDLIAGVVGASAAILLLGAVPSTGDTWRELVRTTGKRVGFALVSAGFAGYAAPVAGAILGGMLGVTLPPERLAEVHHPLRLLASAVIAAGAERFLRALINRGAGKVEGGA